MAPTKGEHHCATDALGIGQCIIGGIAIDLQDAFEAGEMTHGMLGAATGSIQVGDGRRIATAPWSIIARDGPEVASFGATTAWIEDGTACLVGKQLGRCLQDRGKRERTLKVLFP